MGYTDNVTLVAGILSLILIITFFLMAVRLGKISDYLEALLEIEERKPENRKQVTCPECKKDFSLGITKKGFMTCPECKKSIKIE
jgi:ssDNA-binding Zn-finger/Zn-ribbon topoisomerase 1